MKSEQESLNLDSIWIQRCCRVIYLLYIWFKIFEIRNYEAIRGRESQKIALSSLEVSKSVLENSLHTVASSKKF